MPAHVGDPFRLDARQRPRKQLRRFHNLRRHDKGGLPALFRRRALGHFFGTLKDMRSRENLHHPVARRLVNIPLLAPSHMSQQRGQHRAMHSICLRPVRNFQIQTIGPAHAHGIGELAMNIAPLPHPDKRQKRSPA